MRKIQDKVVGSFRKVLGKVVYGEIPEICLQHTALAMRVLFLLLLLCNMSVL